jgi:hypothetical protein
MKLYLATNSTRTHCGIIKKLDVPNILISFHYFKDIMIFEEFTEGWYPKNLIIDSGAFSVWTQKGHIDIDKYIEYCKEVRKAVDEYNAKGHDTNVYFVNLDVLPGNFGVYPTQQQRQESAEAGWKNMEYMESKGIKVIHVFHQHEDFSILEKLMKHSDYIGISPANDESQASKNKWMAKCFAITRANVKCHGFAVTSVNTLLKFPFYSADSSSWVQGGRYAAIPTFKDGKVSAIRYKDKNNLSRLSERSDVSSLEMLESYIPRLEQGAKAYMAAGDHITRVWDYRGIHWDN